MATLADPHFLSRKLLGLKGTGLAQPKTKLAPEATNKTGNKIEPNISICGKGFKVRRPKSLAVVSPNSLAIQPCIYSWMIAENINTII